MTEAETNYANGLRDGEIKAIKEIQVVHNGRLDVHGATLTKLERLYWLMMGAIAVIEVITRF